MPEFPNLRVGARLDEKPELLFVLRKVDHEDLIATELDMQAATRRQGKRRRLVNQDLSSLFGVDIEAATPPAQKIKTPPRKTAYRSNKVKAGRKTAAKGAKPRVRNAKAAPRKRTFTPTGATVSRLRKRFAMTRSQFAGLLGVSPQTIANWETKHGRLKLQKRTLTALTRTWSRK